MKKRRVYAFVFAIVIVVSIIFVSSINLDLNHDGVVNITDLQILAAHFEGKATYNSTFDLNNDSRIDLFDVVKVARDINVSSNSNVTVNLHEPSGMTVICDYNGSVRDSNGHAFGCSDFGGWWTSAGSVDLVPDATNPTGSGYALRFNFQNGTIDQMKAGEATANTFSGGPYKELYIRIRFFIESNDSWDGGKLFYLGAAVGSRNNTGSPTQFYIDGTPDGYDQAKTRIIDQNNVADSVPIDSSKNPPTGTNSAGVWPIGKWITQEFVLTAESSPGAGNGSAYVYVNGSLVGYDNTMNWIPSNDTIVGFNGLQWYGMKNYVIPAPQYYRLGELYIAGKN